jgi:preprotein translocase subunit SecG
MGFIIGLLTLVMVLDCLILVLLVLIQLPKKEAGAGLAFGGAATDALFGAGSGTVLTKITKYAATGFFVLAVFLGILETRHFSRNGSSFENKLSQPGRPPAGALAPASPAPGETAGTNVNPIGQLTPTNMLNLKSTPTVEQTNLPAPATNSGK